MTIEKLKFCVRWSACRGSPSSISLACFKQEEQTKLTYFPFQMATILSLRTAWKADLLSQASLRNVQRQLACFNFFKQEEQIKLTYFPFQMATILPLRTAWIADFLSQASLRDVQRQHCWKRGSGDRQRLWDYGTTERSFNAVSALCVAVERRGLTLT